METTEIKINKWTVSKYSDTEIKITNGFICCYAYISADKKTLYFDVIYCPKTVQKRALQFARKHIKSIYN